VEKFFSVFSVVKFDFYVIIDKYLFLSIKICILMQIPIVTGATCTLSMKQRGEIIVGSGFESFHFLEIYAIVEKRILAEYFVRWHETSVETNIWSCNNSDFVQFHHSCRHFKLHFAEAHGLLLLHSIPQQLQVVIKIVYISYLAWNSNSFGILCSNLAIVYKCIPRIFTHVLPSLELPILGKMMSSKH
jgi:hypothetical protein